MANPLATIRENGGTSRKLYAATAGASLGEIVTAVLHNAAGWEWWPMTPTTVVLAFVGGYFVKDKAAG